MKMNWTDEQKSQLNGKFVDFNCQRVITVSLYQYLITAVKVMSQFEKGFKYIIYSTLGRNREILGKKSKL